MQNAPSLLFRHGGWILSVLTLSVSGVIIKPITTACNLRRGIRADVFEKILSTSSIFPAWRSGLRRPPPVSWITPTSNRNIAEIIAFSHIYFSRTVELHAESLMTGARAMPNLSLMRNYSYTGCHSLELTVHVGLAQTNAGPSAELTCGDLKHIFT